MRFRLTPGLLRRAMHLWAPFRGAGSRVVSIAPDWRRARVELRLKKDRRPAPTA